MPFQIVWVSGRLSRAQGPMSFGTSPSNPTSIRTQQNGIHMLNLIQGHYWQCCSHWHCQCAAGLRNSLVQSWWRCSRSALTEGGAMPLQCQPCCMSWCNPLSLTCHLTPLWNYALSNSNLPPRACGLKVLGSKLRCKTLPDLFINNFKLDSISNSGLQVISKLRK